MNVTLFLGRHWSPPNSAPPCLLAPTRPVPPPAGPPAHAGHYSSSLFSAASSLFFRLRSLREPVSPERAVDAEKMGFAL